MIKTKTKTNTENVKDYLKAHSKGFGCSIGIFTDKNKRKEVGSGTRNTAYGLTRKVGSGKAFATNYYVASQVIKTRNRSNDNGSYSIPERNFFKVAAKPKFWKANNFDFLKSFYKAQPDANIYHRKLGNLGTTVLIRAVLDKRQYQPNTEFTVGLKGFNSPLIDTGQMVRAIDWRKNINGKWIKN